METLNNNETKSQEAGSLEKHPPIETINAETISIEDLPKTIQTQIEVLTELEKKKKKASDDAKNAKTSADNMKTFVTKKFLGKEYKSGDTTKILEDTQKVIGLIAIAQESNAKATACSFKFMQKLSETSEYLFALGCFNFAATEKMIEELTSYGDQLTGHEGISDTIKEKMLEVAKRLNMQKDLMLRQSRFEEKLREMGHELSELKEKWNRVLREKEHEISDLKEVVETISTRQNKFAENLQEKDRRIIDLKKTFEKTKSEIQSVLKKHKWLFWIVGGLFIALIVLFIICL